MAGSGFLAGAADAVPLAVMKMPIAHSSDRLRLDRSFIVLPPRLTAVQDGS
jgi:hypothetical protein